MKALKIIGWVCVPYIMIFVSWRALGKAAKGFGIVWALFAFLMVIGNLNKDNSKAKEASSPASNPPISTPAQDAEKAQAKAEADTKAKEEADAKAKADAEAKQAEEDKKKKDTQDSVLAFEKSAYALEATVKPVMDNYTNTMNALGQGKSNINTAYEAANSAMKASQNLQLKFASLAVPKNLPKDVDKILQDARLDLSTAYYSKKKAFEAVMKYLDDQKPSNMQAFKDESKSSDQFVLSGVAKIMDAKTKVGIDIAAQ